MFASPGDHYRPANNLAVSASILLVVLAGTALVGALSNAYQIGLFFVPVASLFKPYFVLKELWKASSPNLQGEWRQAAVSHVLKFWWAVSIVSILNQYSPVPVLLGSKRLARISDSSAIWLYGDGLRDFLCGRVLGDISEVAWCVLTTIVILSITNLQERRCVPS
jgi:hypothetical protein